MKWSANQKLHEMVGNSHLPLKWSAIQKSHSKTVRRRLNWATWSANLMVHQMLQSMVGKTDVASNGRQNRCCIGWSANQLQYKIVGKTKSTQKWSVKHILHKMVGKTDCVQIGRQIPSCSYWSAKPQKQLYKKLVGNLTVHLLDAHFQSHFQRGIFPNFLEFFGGALSARFFLEFFSIAIRLL